MIVHYEEIEKMLDFCQVEELESEDQLFTADEVEMSALDWEYRQIITGWDFSDENLIEFQESGVL